MLYLYDTENMLICKEPIDNCIACFPPNKPGAEQTPLSTMYPYDEHHQ